MLSDQFAKSFFPKALQIVRVVDRNFMLFPLVKATDKSTYFHYIHRFVECIDKDLPIYTHIPLTHTVFHPYIFNSYSLALSVHYISTILSHPYVLIYSCPSVLSVIYGEATDEPVRKPL